MQLKEPRTVSITGGEFIMGMPPCPADVSIERRWPSGDLVNVAPFRIGMFPVTNGEYKAYIESTNTGAPSHVSVHGYEADDQPIVQVSWEDAVAYCRWLTDGTGKPYRLPSDAEWEYAARGCREACRFPWGDEINPQYAWYGGRSAPAQVGRFPANDFGLYDMIGNVWEWCDDLFHRVSGGMQATNSPTGKDPAGNRVLRGGSFLTTDDLHLWVAYRHEDPVDLRHECIGIRVALTA